MEDPLTRLFSLSEDIGGRFKNRSKRISRGTLFVKLALLALGGLAAGASQFFLIPEGEVFGVWNSVGVIGAALVFLGALYLAATDEDASDDLESARSAISTAYELYAQLDDLEIYFDEMERAKELYFAMKTMAQTLESWLTQERRGTEDELVQALVESAARSLRIALGFQVADHWTICIYKATPTDADARTMLTCVGHDRSVMCELKDARPWPDGVGIPGVAFASGREVVIPNLFAPGVSDIFHVNENVEARETDKSRYSSAAAVPILVEPHKTPWGVVVATSSCTDHFHNNEKPGLHTIDAVRALAAMIALAFSANSAISCKTGPENGGSEPKKTPEKP
ncbi:GAF domain-containing protein [Hyphococcus luteus]|uniref:Uncharacterized protein n=1 Tax=Hyphococcus luteus TaxID=2058213 RepID=A0A2S7K3V3_9PROT|nr:GAF domain-containing protein [Marinicaulis flavus]PQA87190.1 hypothetical protein CW354_14215 [Marinicaulis flavus]